MRPFLGILILICTILLAACGDGKIGKTYKIEKPFKNLSLASKQVSFDPSKAQILDFGNEMRIQVPKDAFVDAQGNLVTDEVTIEMENYNNPAKIIASGIPMEYGEETFQTAGMFKLSGKSKGQEVQVKKGKQLQVDYNSKEYGDYDFFRFNQNGDEGAWKKLSEKVVTNCFSENDVFKKIQFKFDTTNYPQLAALQNMDWKLANDWLDPSSEQHKWALEENWTVVELSKPQKGVRKHLIETSERYYDISEDYKTLLTYSSLKGGSASLWSVETGKLKSTFKLL